MFTISKVAPSTLSPFEDRWSADAPGALMSGVQAIVRALLDQRRDDQAAAIVSAGFASGYPGSPLAGLDRELQRRAGDLAQVGVTFQPGLNEELAATAVWGSQLAHLQRGARVAGVLGLWFGKSPGLDRAADALRHANVCGVGPASGAVAVVGDDPACKSSTLPSASERTLSGLLTPVLAPASVQDVLDLGRHALRLSRAAGLWCALKIVADVADASATVVHRGQLDPVRRLIDHTPNAHLLGAAAIAAERSLHELRLPAALDYARAHDLNPTVVEGSRDEVGLVAGGSAYAELCRALLELGLGEPELQALGVRVLKVGMPWPLDHERIREFARGLRIVLVVEDKLPQLETEVKAALHGLAAAPQVLGKQDEQGRPLLASHGALDADQISLALAALLGGRLRADTQAAQRLRRLAAAPTASLAPLARAPFFCSGCPHSTSTMAAPETLVGAGIGCHVMLVQGGSRAGEQAPGNDRRGETAGDEVVAGAGRAGEVVGLTQMGGEGAQWIGMAPFVQADRFTQNLGDGTFHHSGSLALRAAVAAKVNITYKLLYNDAVAMTGGQAVEGAMSVPELTRMLAAEGVARIVVTSDRPRRYKRVRLAAGTKVRDRSQLPQVEAELAALPGVTVIVHDQMCAAERRRLVRRGKLPAAPQRAWINERVCEGCGDCARQSGCLSLEPVQTELGRKTRVNQQSCNVDMSCLRGDCPSFLTVRPVARRHQPRRPPNGLPNPDGWDGPTPPRRDPLRGAPSGQPDPHGWSGPNPPRRQDGARPDAAGASSTIRLVGIGGTGVVTVAQVLAMAAHLEGRPAAVLDQTGLSQKAGSVVSDVRIGAQAGSPATPRAARLSVDLLLGFDLLGAADPRFAAACDPQRTIAVLSTAESPTGEMVLQTGARFPEREALLAAIGRHTAAMPVLADAQLIAQRALGDDLQANMVLLGAAWQLGALPVGWQALCQSVELNGAAVEQNLIALRWGRAVVAAPEAVQRLLDEGRPATGRGSAQPWPPSPRALAEVRARALPPQAHELIARRVEDLHAYGGPRIVARYLAELERVAAVEAQRARGHAELTESAARQLHRLLAYKDEYEVARLHLLPQERERREQELGRGARWWLHLHPPLLRALGFSRKIRLGRWSLPLLYALRAGRRLRGTPLDLFGHTQVRRIERALPGEYLALLAQGLDLLSEDTHAGVVALSEQAEQIRGYEQIKLASVVAWRAGSAQLLQRLQSQRKA